MNFVGLAKPLDDVDLPRIGHRIGVGEDKIHAVMDVEAGTSGFDSKKRPKMLFEPHIFYKQLSLYPKVRDSAVSQGLAYPTWRRNYPKDSYPRLEQAMVIAEEAALKSASWGRGQIMGFNATAAGFPNVYAMVEAFKADEEHHINAMVSFIISAGLDDELYRGDWRGFARGYNGPSYEANNYHIKLAAAYKKWQAIKDTEWFPELDLDPTPTPEPMAPVVNIDPRLYVFQQEQLARIQLILDEKPKLA